MSLDLQLVRSLRERAARDATGLFVVEGLRFLFLARDAGREVEALLVSPDLAPPETVTLARRLTGRRAPALEVDGSTYRELTVAHEPQGVAAVVRQRWSPLPATPGPRDLWVALRRVRSPGNLGTLLRTCDAAAASGAIVLGRDVDPHHPTCVRASMGSLLSRRLVRADDLGAVRAWLRRRGGALVGASPAATRDYAAVDYARPVVIVLGDEREGLDADDEDRCDALVTIPMAGRLDSLNLAVAGSLLLYEAFNQRRRARPRARAGRASRR